MSSQMSDDDEVVADVMQAVLEGATLQDLHGISDGQMESLYGYAYDFYCQGRLEDAEKFFRFLCIYNFNNTDYWMGLAAVYQMQKRFEKALDMYTVVFAQSKADYSSMLHAGQCQLALRRVGKARRCFELVIERGTAELCAKAQSYLDAMRQAADASANEDDDE
ncbi:Type III secretion chaperone protein for YopD (SycD) [Pseudomonas synxantha]|uniref:SycD/LcrH family type III secretion system chaperone n=1 Tax=Pseudomonas synxantha TaxID=47883 RepID=UPI000F57E22A|nr:SycD/LcrH family type III secretion system chaperone [Pseudomonas synxantha]AZE72356.1 Type III secretion chaperone protein for YopD (SycD) [Pseudomonas synxantha]AZE78023.1 Type III secretion chaperone protein for YopD (SycD) [Pseudomonas synxantha]